MPIKVKLASLPASAAAPGGCRKPIVARSDEHGQLWGMGGETTPSTDWFQIRSVREKIAGLGSAVEAGLKLNGEGRREFKLGRDLTIVPPSQLPPKPGLSYIEGQARLLHDLASIELQATELAVRGLYEFPDAPRDFREQLAEIAIGEGRHLKMCLDTMETLGYEWGHWDAHLALWNAVGPADTLLDRILIVHRYLEGSGLDSGESLLRRLKGMKKPAPREVVEVIVREEVDHVAFGSRWYHRLASDAGLDVEQDFKTRIEHISKLVPRREGLARELRARAGFTPFEIQVLEDVLKTEFSRHRANPDLVSNSITE